MDKKVSIVIPTFNRANLLVKTIESALNQTVNCEIIVCDHGSSDNTPEVMEKYKNKVKYIRRDKDLGMHFCWLEGGLSTTNDLIHIHYDDDYMEPTFIERTLSLRLNILDFSLSALSSVTSKSTRFEKTS